MRVFTATNQEETKSWPTDGMTPLSLMGEHNIVKFEFTNEEFEQSGGNLLKFAKIQNPTNEEQTWGDDEVISDEDEILADYELVESPILIRDSSPKKELKDLAEDQKTVSEGNSNHPDLEENKKKVAC